MPQIQDWWRRCWHLLWLNRRAFQSAEMLCCLDSFCLCFFSLFVREKLTSKKDHRNLS